MLRNCEIIVTKIQSHYQIILPNPCRDGKLYVTCRPYSGEDTFLCDVTGNEVVVPDPNPGVRPYFILKYPGRPDALAGDRLVACPPVENFRDQGGYIGAEGKSVKWGRFFRGGAFHPMDEAGGSYLDGLSLGNIFDYRDKAEAAKAPDYVSDGTAYHLLPAMRVTIGEANQAAVYSVEEQMNLIKTEEEAAIVVDQFHGLYRDLPFHNPSYAAMLAALDREEPLYQHCSAGKDRTGVGCVLLLSALGVDRATVTGDYCLSTPYREKANRHHLRAFDEKFHNPIAREVLRRLFSVEESFIQAAFAEIDKKYSSMEEFFLEEYNVTEERLAYWRGLHLV